MNRKYRQGYEEALKKGIKELSYEKVVDLRNKALRLATVYGYHDFARGYARACDRELYFKDWNTYEGYYRAIKTEGDW